MKTGVRAPHLPLGVSHQQVINYVVGDGNVKVKKVSGVTFTLDGVRSGVAVVWGRAECKHGNFINVTAGQSV